ncbi:MAG TPA: hypothetical protein P5340_13465 [Defluviicoccus sp.]|nr:hypothetical protein [Defluviicoccus sp.]
MLTSLALGVVLLIGLVLLGRWFVTADPKLLVRLGKGLAVAAVAVVAVVLIATGRFGIVLTAAMLGLPLILRFFRTSGFGHGPWQAGPAAPGGGPRVSSIRTRFLAMTLDHASGDLDGSVIAGTFAGRLLKQLTLAELMMLMGEWQTADPSSCQVLETYLDRMHPGWRATATGGEAGGRAGEGGGASRTAATMTREEALRVLGLAPDATSEDIQAAHHRLIALLHPDRGGSSFLAAQVNLARDLLLNR